MKKLTILLFMVLSFMAARAQDQPEKNDSNYYRVEKTDGGELIGRIIKQDKNEIILKTVDGRTIGIPQHLIKKIEALDRTQFNLQGDFIGEDPFANRYFVGTNGLPIEKGKHYVQWSLYGPDIEFGLGGDFSAGVMTSWLGSPIIGNIKKGWKLSGKTQFAVGVLGGYGGWWDPTFYGAVPYVTLSFGDKRTNISLTGGYGFFGNEFGSHRRWAGEVAGMKRISSKLSLVFESLLVFDAPDAYSLAANSDQELKNAGFAIILPGLRWHQNQNRAWQFGFGGFVTRSGVFPIPIPMVQLFSKL